MGKTKSVLISIQPYYVFLIIARLMGWNIPQEKTIEVRKDFPKDSAWNKRAYIYCSKNRKSFNRIPKQYQSFMEKLLGKVIGEFACDRIEEYNCEFWGSDDYMSPLHAMEQIRILDYVDEDDPDWKEYCYVTGNEVENPDECKLCRESCLTYSEIRKYIGKGDKTFYGWNISDLKIYDTPKELGKFYLSNPNIQCEYRQRGYNMDFCTAFEGGSRFCKQLNCDKKRISRPPQSWCYVEE